ncbi:cytochrome d ubiquinol oxidase subunit II [Tundrisphaera lichenicola]|uniref:cytochrome d ubiquinol oxidase subunit II n=1 Tax=Tundrisphaera lichenicola TaxID=2029860 RepID=UPI003EBFB8D2
MSLPEILASIMLAALTLYALFGGADYGGGVWDLLAAGPRAKAQRDLIAHAIGPVWEANHVWLIFVIVVLFTAFPPAFHTVMTHLHLPLSLMLVGIVLRGSAFTFRNYDTSPGAERRWNHRFSIPSVITPVLLGMIIGSIATGRLDLNGGPMLWLTPFPIAVGLFTLALFAYLAAVYLTLETDDRELADDFRIRAIVSGAISGVLALVVYELSREEAPMIFRGLSANPWGFGVRLTTALFASLALACLYKRQYAIARPLAMLQVVFVLLGCGLALHPNLVPPGRTIENSASPAITLRLMLGAIGAGSLILVPSIYYLFRIFKSRRVDSLGD